MVLRQSMSLKKFLEKAGISKKTKLSQSTTWQLPARYRLKIWHS